LKLSQHCFFLFFSFFEEEGKGRKPWIAYVRTALTEYNLKFGTILNYPDLASFRALPEFRE
jgi:hypothetical protein